MKKSEDIRKTTKYRQWVDSVKERDGNRCRACLAKYNLEAHHIYRVKSHPDLVFVEDNGITLCKQCHVKLSNRENDLGFLIQVINEPINKQLNRLQQTLFATGIKPDVSKNEKDSFVLIPAQFDKVWHFQEGLARFRSGDDNTGKYGFIQY